ncbi:MAG: ABC transporter substrate-binding protein [Thermofilaceae archaeon]
MATQPKILTILLLALLVIAVLEVAILAYLATSIGAVAALEPRLKTLESTTGDVLTALRAMTSTLEKYGADVAELSKRLEEVEKRLVAPPLEFRLGGWWPWPYHGNPYAPGGVGVLYWFGFETFAYLIPANQTFIPRLAESWKVDGNKLTVKLRVTAWVDGNPVRADDVVTAIYVAQAMWEWPYEIKSATKVDDRTVVIEFEEPPGPGLLVSILTSPFVSFAPNHIYGKWLDRAKEVATLGREIWLARLKGLEVPKEKIDRYTELRAKLRDEITALNLLEKYGYVPSNGLYTVESVAYDKMVMRLNTLHWQAPTASAKRVIVYRWTSNEQIWALYLAGELDTSHPATPKDVADQILRLGPKMKLNTVTDLCETPVIVFNFRNPLFRDINLRKALIHSLNRATVRDITFWFMPVPIYAHGVLPSFERFWLDEATLAQLTRWEYNPSEAERILRAAGYTKGPDGIWRTPDGKPVKFTLIAYAPYSDWVIAAKEIANQWKAFGFDVDVKLIPEGMYGPTLEAGEFDAAIEFGSAWWGVGHPWAGYDRLWGGGWIATVTGIRALDLNMVEYDTPWGKFKPFELVRALMAEVDPVKQKDLVRKLAYITNKQVIYIPIVEKGLQIFYSEARWTGWPAHDDPLWSLAPGGIERVYVVLLGGGVLKPVTG